MDKRVEPIAQSHLLDKLEDGLDWITEGDGIPWLILGTIAVSWLADIMTKLNVHWVYVVNTTNP